MELLSNILVAAPCDAVPVVVPVESFISREASVVAASLVLTLILRVLYLTSFYSLV